MYYENDYDLLQNVCETLNITEEDVTRTRNIFFNLSEKLTFYVPVNEDDEYVLMNKGKSIPLFLNDTGVDEFIEKYNYNNIQLKDIKLDDLKDLDIEYLLINPTDEHIFLDKSVLNIEYGTYVNVEQIYGMIRFIGTFLKNIRFPILFKKKKPISKHRKIVILFNEKDRKKFIKKNANYNLKFIPFEELVDLKTKQYYVNPASDKITLIKDEIELNDYLYVMEKMIQSLINQNEELGEVEKDRMKGLWLSPFNVMLRNTSEDSEEHELSSELSYYNEKCFFLTTENKKPIKNDNGDAIPIFTEYEYYLKWENLTNFDLDSKFYIDTLSNFIEDTKTEEEDFIINPFTDDVILTKEDYKEFNKLAESIDIDENNEDEEFEAIEDSDEMYGYDIKIRLDNFRPLTWRDLIIPGGITFEDLHQIIQKLMDFYNMHLYEFEINNNLVMIDERSDIDDFLSPPGLKQLYAKDEIIDPYFNKKKKIGYRYDFGDGWSFTIEIKKKVKYEHRYATLKRYKGEYNPVEDCGGVWGLSELIEEKQFANEDDEYYDDEFSFDLNKFDLEEKKEMLESLEFK